MITLKSPHEIELMRRAGKITAAARAYAGEMVKPGVTTHEIDRAVEHFIRKQGAVPPSCITTAIRPAPASASTMRSSTAFPDPGSSRRAISSVWDVGAYIGGFHGDCAATFPAAGSPRRRRI